MVGSYESALQGVKGTITDAKQGLEVLRELPSVNFQTQGVCCKRLAPHAHLLYLGVIALLNNR